MVEFAATSPSTATVAFVMGAAFLAGQSQFPPRVDPYFVQQERNTYSTFMDQLSRPIGTQHFADTVATMYNIFMQRQERLGEDFEAALLGDMDSLYEA